jgi:hypothetical protein
METYYKRAEIKKYLDDRLRDMGIKEIHKLIKDGELHNEIFNTDYYMVYTGECEDWLGKEAFDIIRTVKEYEQDNFGETFTDLSDPCKLVNMYVYIVGEELIQEVISNMREFN